MGHGGWGIGRVARLLVFPHASCPTPSCPTSRPAHSCAVATSTMTRFESAEALRSSAGFRRPDEARRHGPAVDAQAERVAQRDAQRSAVPRLITAAPGTVRNTPGSTPARCLARAGREERPEGRLGEQVHAEHADDARRVAGHARRRVHDRRHARHAGLGGRGAPRGRPARRPARRRPGASPGPSAPRRTARRPAARSRWRGPRPRRPRRPRPRRGSRGREPRVAQEVAEAAEGEQNAVGGRQEGGGKSGQPQAACAA